jgi:hypothetical protein
VPVLLPSKAPVSGDVTTVHGAGFGRRTHYYKPLTCGGSCSPPEIE